MVRHCSECGRRGHDRRAHERLSNPPFFTDKMGRRRPIRSELGRNYDPYYDKDYASYHRSKRKKKKR